MPRRGLEFMAAVFIHFRSSRVMTLPRGRGPGPGHRFVGRTAPPHYSWHRPPDAHPATGHAAREGPGALQPRNPGEADVRALSDGEVAEGLGDVCLARAHGAEQDHGLAGMEPAQGG